MCSQLELSSVGAPYMDFRKERGGKRMNLVVGRWGFFDRGHWSGWGLGKCLSGGCGGFGGRGGGGLKAKNIVMLFPQFCG